MASIAGLNQHAIACLVSTGGFVVGLALGWNSLAGFVLRSAIGWDMADADAVVAAIGAGAGVGALALPSLMQSGTSCSSVARYLLIWLVAGWLLVYFADFSTLQYQELIIGRGLIGLAVGAISVQAPLYIAEISSGEQRYAQLCYYHLMLAAGIGCSYLVGLVAHTEDDKPGELPPKYSLACALAGLPTLLCYAVPASPFRLATRDVAEVGEHVRSLGWWTADQDLAREAQRVQDLARMTSVPVKLQTLRSRKYWQALVLVGATMLCHHLTGASSFTFNTLTLASFAGSASLDPSQLCVLIGALQIAASIFAVLLIARHGRRPFLVASLSIMALSMACLSWYVMASQTNSNLGIAYSWVPPTLIILYLGSYNLGLGPISWSLLADSFPVELRVFTASIIVSASWFLCMAVNANLSRLLYSMGLPALLWSFAGFSLLGALLAWFLFGSESWGKSLADIQEEFQIG